MNVLNKITRFFKFILQRIILGFDDSDTWNLDNTIAEFILPRLKKFRELSIGSPLLEGYGFGEELTDEESKNMQEEWNKILDKMIFSFERISKEDEFDFVKYPENYDFGFTTKKIKERNDVVQLVPNDNRELDYTEYEKVRKQIQEGLDLFAKYFRSLWW